MLFQTNVRVHDVIKCGMVISLRLCKHLKHILCYHIVAISTNTSW
jgi:hypothetical protein